jgi:hypothetical protein
MRRTRRVDHVGRSLKQTHQAGDGVDSDGGGEEAGREEEQVQ